MSVGIKESLSIADGINLDSINLDSEAYSTTLSKFKDTTSKELGISRPDDLTFFYRVVRQISDGIIEVLKNGESLSAKELKNQITKVSTIGDIKIFDGRSFNRQTEESLLSLSNNPKYWYRRVLGGIREHLFPLENQQEVKQALGNLISNPESLEKITGPDGYRRVAQLFCGGSMLKAYILASAVTKEKGLKFADLEWGSAIQCSTDEFKNLGELIKKPGFGDKYKGIEGYQKFADDHADKSMQKAYLLASAITKVVGLKFDKLKWGSQIPCTTEKFEALRKVIKKPEFLSEYKGIEGYQKFADKYADKSMEKAYKLASAITKVVGLTFDDLEWGSQIQCATKEFKNLRDLIKEPGFGDKYKGIEGYQKFADDKAGGSMLKAYMLASAITKVVGLEFDNLGWGSQFQGDTKEYKLIQQSLGDLISAGKIDSLMSLDLSDRLPQLVSLMRGLSENHAKDLRDISLRDFYVALPDRLSDKVTKRDFSPSYLKLFINGEAVYFDSAEERVCGYLLHKYQLVDKFVEGENLHVRANNVNRIDLDFYLEDYGVFIEYHPQSQRDRAEGRSLEEAGIRKTESIKLGGYKKCRAFHISDYDGLYNVLVKELGVKLSYQQFLSDVSEAEKVGAAMNLELQLIS